MFRNINNQTEARKIKKYAIMERKFTIFVGLRKTNKLNNINYETYHFELRAA